MVPGAIESLVLLALSLLFFVVIGIRQSSLRDSNDVFWFAGRNLSAAELTATWSASSLSLGLTILYYMAMTSVFGWKIFIISISTYLIGQLTFRSVSRSWRTKNPNTEASVDELVTAGTGQPTLVRLAQYSGLFSLMAMLYAELFFSALIVNSILGASAPPWATTALFVVSLSVVSAYVLLGGMRAVIESDRWQLLLVYAAVGTLVVLAITLLLTGTPFQFASSLPWFETRIDKVDTASYLLFGLAANILPLLCQNSLWQMASSTAPSNIGSGAIGGILRTFVTFTIVIMVAFVINGTGKGVTSGVLVHSMVALGQFGSHFLLPIMFVGLLAAMLSTADNLLLGSALSAKHLLDGSNFKAWKTLPEVNQRLALVLGIATVQVAVLLGVSYILEKDFFSYFLSLVFFLFSQAAPFGVVVLLAVICPHRLRRSGIIVGGVAAAWLLDFSAFLYASAYGVQKVQFFATPMAILISFLSSFTFSTSAAQVKDQGANK